MSASTELVDQELDALEAILGDDCRVDRLARTVEVYVPDATIQPRLVARALLPDTYPVSSPPLLELHAPHVSEDQLQWATNELGQQFVPGDSVLYAWFSWLKEQPQLWEAPGASAAAIESATHDLQGPRHCRRHGAGQETLPSDTGPDGGGGGKSGSRGDSGSAAEWQPWVVHGDDGTEPSYMSSADNVINSLAKGTNTTRKQDHLISRSEDTAAVDEAAGTIVSGEPVTERKSTFQAHVAPITDLAQVSHVVAALMRNNKIRNATHNILAYRIMTPGKTTCTQDYDDDGEAAAGGRLLHLLQVADVRNVVVVVSRWFGGIQLGPARFGLISNTARALLEQQGMLKRNSSGRLHTGPGGGATGGKHGAQRRK